MSDHTKEPVFYKVPREKWTKTVAQCLSEVEIKMLENEYNRQLVGRTLKVLDYMYLGELQGRDYIPVMGQSGVGPATAELIHLLIQHVGVSRTTEPIIARVPMAVKHLMALHGIDINLPGNVWVSLPRAMYIIRHGHQLYPKTSRKLKAVVAECEPRFGQIQSKKKAVPKRIKVKS